MTVTGLMYGCSRWVKCRACHGRHPGLWLICPYEKRPPSGEVG
jgi:hypothetical protein